MTPASPASDETPLPEGAKRRVAVWLWLCGLAIVYLVLNNAFLQYTVRDSALAQKMQAKDSRQYIEIARDFAHGDFSMSYVQYKPHRQPLYPLLLAVPERIWGDDLYKLGWVNIVAGLALLVWLFFGVLRFFDSLALAVLVSIAFVSNPFMIDKQACRIMTEPLHALFLVVLIFCFLDYIRRPRLVYLLGVAAAAALDYLARTNGLFVCASAFGILGLHDLWRLARPSSENARSLGRRVGSLVLSYLGAVVVLVLVAAPSWVPRVQYFHDPIYHGYLSNYMWVDSYEEAHTGQAHTDFGLKDYAKTHGAGEIVGRWVQGLYRVYYDVPRHTEHVRVLYLLAVIGVVVAIVQRRVEFCLLALFLFIQLLPVVWTIMSNPGPRIAYGTMFPFELFFAALCLATAIPFAMKRLRAKASQAPVAS